MPFYIVLVLTGNDSLAPEHGDKLLKLSSQLLHLPSCMVSDTREHRTPTRGDRAPVVRRPDNLRPEGDFPDRPHDQAPKGERAPVVRRPDNLVMEGEFIGMFFFYK